MRGYESQSFDPVDSRLETIKRAATPARELRNQERLRWALSALIGAAMGVIAFLVNVGIRGLLRAKFGSVRALIEPGSSAFLVPFLVYVAWAVGLSAAAGCLVSFVEPLAAGSGIPELKTYLNGVQLPRLLRLHTLVAKLIGIMFTIGGGLIAGKEGPFVHGGGIVGSGLSQMASVSLGWSARSLRHFRDRVSHRDFTAIGTAAGVASAFNAPIGGVLFAIEEGASFYSSTLLWRGFLATSTAVVSIQLLERLTELFVEPASFVNEKLGVHRDFGLYSDQQAKLSQHFWWFIWETPIFALMGVAGGLFGVFFVRLNLLVMAWRRKHVPPTSPLRRLLEVVIIALATATVVFMLSYVSPCREKPEYLLPGSNCTDFFNPVDTEAFTIDRSIADEYFPTLWCEQDEYSVFGQLLLVPLADALKFLLHLSETQAAACLTGPSEDADMLKFNFSALIVFAAVVTCFMTWTYGVGAPQGLFVPSLAVGAAFGRIMGRVVREVVKWAGVSAIIDLETYAVIGAASTLGGATRMTISITVLVMETTGALQLVVPIMLAIFFAKYVGDMFSKGIYDAHIELKGAPVLEEPEIMETEAPGVADRLSAGDVMSAPLSGMVSMQPIMLVGDILRILRSCTHNAFPIVADERPSVSCAGASAGRPEASSSPSAGGNGHQVEASSVALAGPQPSPSQSQPTSWSFRRRGSQSNLFASPLDSPKADGPGGAPEVVLQGVVWRDQLLKMIKYRVGVLSEGESIVLPQSHEELSRILEWLEEVPRPAPSADNAAGERELCLNPQLLRSHLDLRPFMQCHPHVVPHEASLRRAYRLFRTMGLRHLFVTSRKPVVVGVITRKDIIIDSTKLRLHQSTAGHGAGSMGVGRSVPRRRRGILSPLGSTRSSEGYDRVMQEEEML